MAKRNITPQVPGQLPAETEPVEVSAPVVEQQPATAADLPDEADIDPTTITRPVLTKRGWLVPEKVR